MKKSDYASPQSLPKRNGSPYSQVKLTERSPSIFYSSGISSISNEYNPSVGQYQSYFQCLPPNRGQQIFSSETTNFTSNKAQSDWDASSKTSGMQNPTTSTREPHDNYRSEIRANAGYHGQRYEQWVSNKPVTRLNYKSASLSVDTKRGTRGLRNIGNTCYMNSVLHALFNTPQLFAYFQRHISLKPLKEKSTEVTNAFMDLLNKIHEDSFKISSADAESTLTFKKAIEKSSDQFSGYFQQDAQEFLRKVLDSLHEELNRVTVRPRYRLIDMEPKSSNLSKLADDWFEYLKYFDNSLITDFFTGQLLSSKNCDVCKKRSYAFDNFLDLSLPFPSSSRSKIKQVRLDQLLDLFFREEVLEDPLVCDQCQERRRFFKKFSIWRLPDILVIHLKRFYYKSTLREKISTAVVFPIADLNINKHCHASDHPSTKCTNYDLYAVINHFGTLSKGHYIAECQNLHNQRWYRFDDENVTEIDIKENKYDTDGSTAPYLLFYKKK